MSLDESQPATRNIEVMSPFNMPIPQELRVNHEQYDRFSSSHLSTPKDRESRKLSSDIPTAFKAKTLHQQVSLVREARKLSAVQQSLEDPRRSSVHHANTAMTHSSVQATDARRLSSISGQKGRFTKDTFLSISLLLFLLLASFNR